MSDHEEPGLAELLVYMVDRARGFEGGARTIQLLYDHLITDHMIGLGNRRRDKEFLRHYAAFARGELVNDHDKLIVKNIEE